MSDPLEPYRQDSEADGLARILWAFQPWRWTSEWLQDVWDDWLDRLYWWRESGALRFLSGMSYGLVLGAGVMWLWAPVVSHPSARHVTEGTPGPVVVANSRARHPDVVVEVEPLAARLQVRESSRTASAAVASDMVVEVEAFLAGLKASEPNLSWQTQVLTSVQPVAFPSPPVPALAAPPSADSAPSLPIRAQVVLALPPDLSPAPTEAFAAIALDLDYTAASLVRSPREAPALPAPEASESEVPNATSTSPAKAPGRAREMAEVELIQPSEESTDPELNAPLIRPRSREGAVARAWLAENQAAQPPEAAGRVQVVSPQCNIQRCAAAHRSFRASDCTYQPYEGPRQLCQ